MNVIRKAHDKGIIEYILKNDNGMTVKLINIGCSITEILVPDKNGEYSNVVLRHESLEEYFRNEHFLGAVIVPLAGRLENAKFTINNEVYNFTTNEGDNLLHSGEINPYNKIWDSSMEDDKVVFQYKIGDEYPGAPLFTVKYMLSDDNELKLEYEVIAESETVVAPTNHTYFNLGAEDAGSHLITSNTESYLKMNEKLIAKSVEKCEGLFDLKQECLFSDILTSNDAQIDIANGGFDHYFIFEEDNQSVHITDKNSGRAMTVKTTFPGMVLYTGNNLDESVILKDRKSQKYAGFCLETQCSPSALKLPLNQDLRIDRGVPYKKETVFSFSTEG